MSDKRKYFVILGGNFVNIGAEAMTFVTVSALKKRYPNCEIVMVSQFDASKDNSNFTFRVLDLSERVIKHSVKTRFDPEYVVSGMAKLMLGKGNNFKQTRVLRELLTKCSAVFDISGYAISSQWPNEITLSKLRYVDLFTSNGIPFYFMPQSFGPFEYDDNKEYMLLRLRESLPKSSKIFVREDEGYQLLSSLIGKDRVAKSYDMVLQSRDIDREDIYKIAPDIKKVNIETSGNVAVIPNMRNFDHGNKEEILSLYRDVVQLLLDLGKNVYLISHSAEDKAACGMIKEKFLKNSGVIQVAERIDSWNFDGLIRQFDFAIASRYHSIVHSYKAGVPCIALGWATKYHELLKTVDQSQYIFDVRDLGKKDIILSAIEQMSTLVKKEKATIQQRVAAIQETNCFDSIDF